MMKKDSSVVEKVGRPFSCMEKTRHKHAHARPKGETASKGIKLDFFKGAIASD